MYVSGLMNSNTDPRCVNPGLVLRRIGYVFGFTYMELMLF